MNELKKIAQKATRLLFFFGVVAIVCILLFAEYFFSFIGDDFVEGTMILIIFSLGQFVNVITGSVGYLLIMCGYESIMTINVIIVSILTVILFFLLTPVWGVLGAAIATSLGLSVQNLIATYFVKQKLGFWVFDFSTFLRKKNVEYYEN